jgi:hypothetical protein
MQQTIYSAGAGYKLIDHYVNELNGRYCLVKEGSLLDGVVILKAKNSKTAVIREVYINEWSSGYSIRMYNRCPKKYEHL